MKSSDWKIIAASVAGTSHIAKGVSCQDAFAYQIFDSAEGEVLLIVVTDGAGSAKSGQTGAENTCEFFMQGIGEWLKEKRQVIDLTQDFGVSCLNLLQTELAKKAETEEQTLADFACTFLAVVIGRKTNVFYQLGDGAIVYAANDGFQLFTPPQQGEYANTTHFVTDETAKDFLQFGLVEQEINQIAVFTDGLQRIALSFNADAKKQTPHEPFFRPIFAPLQAENIAPNLSDKLKEFLDSPKINERTDDDKTLVLASRNSGQ